VTLLHYLLARCTTLWANTMRRYPLLWAQARLLPRKRVLPALRSTWRQLYVSANITIIRTSYAQRFSAKAIDRYISSRNKDGQDKIDPRLGEIIEDIFRRCIEDGEYKQV
jgi:hypothetical protein